MKRMPTSVYKELHTIRDKYGENEYHRDELLPAAMGLLSKHLDDGKELLKDLANSVLDRMDKADDSAGQGLFPYKAQIALGEKKRIKRGAMNLGQLNRRKRVIDHNKASQDTAWIGETNWLNNAGDALEGRPPETKVSDVIAEQSA